jgi:hypothetical protein
MRKINHIVIHCSATVEGKPFNRAAIKAMHLARGFTDIGYHYIILLDGTIEKGRADDVVGAHVSGHNANSIGVCYIGGIGKNGKGKDTRTPAQKCAMDSLIDTLKGQYPGAKVSGHRDFSPDKNKDGKITPDEFIKECPCFDAKVEYA